jgi:D-sedoheptulose 7-phosphate isomerase
MKSYLSAYLAESARAAAALAAEENAAASLCAIATAIAAALRRRNMVMLAGNGGSAADAQHIAAEFVSRLMIDRKPFAALALSESGPILTACGNDYGCDTVFARQVEALGRAGDVLLCLSTSGHSRNLLRAIDAARGLDVTTIGFTGQTGGAMTGLCDLVFAAPSASPQIVQQLHMMAAHAVLATVERDVFAPPTLATTPS